MNERLENKRIVTEVRIIYFSNRSLCSVISCVFFSFNILYIDNKVNCIRGETWSITEYVLKKIRKTIIRYLRISHVK